MCATPVGRVGIVEITLRKCYRQWRRHQAAGRDVRQESPLDRRSPAQDDSWQLVATEPTPLQAAMLEETHLALLGAFEGRERKMLELALQGEPANKIGPQVDRTERSVRRFMQTVRKKLERMAALAE